MFFSTTGRVGHPPIRSPIRRLVASGEPERGISPLYSCGKIHIRVLCAAALTIVLQKSTLPDRRNSQTPSFRMKWQMLSAPWSQRLSRFEDAVIPSEVPYPTWRRRCASLDASEGTAFGDLLPGVSSAPKLGQQLRTNLPSTLVWNDGRKFPVMNTCMLDGDL
jgi:hypothetical protein